MNFKVFPRFSRSLSRQSPKRLRPALDLLETRALLTTGVAIQSGVDIVAPIDGGSTGQLVLNFEPHFLQGYLSVPSKAAELKAFLQNPGGSLQIKTSWTTSVQLQNFQFASISVTVDGKDYNISQTVGWVDGVIFADASGNAVGTSGNDLIIGRSSWPVVNGTLAGLGGDDLIIGRNGNDTIDGGAGDDWLFGNAGNDTIYGGEGGGNDWIYGGDGDDTLNGGGGVDKVYGEGGNDTILFDWVVWQVGEVADGGAGVDRLEIRFAPSVLQAVLPTAGSALNTYTAAPSNKTLNTSGFNVALTASAFEKASTIILHDGVYYNATEEIGNVDSVIIGTASKTDSVYLNGTSGNDVIIGTNLWGGYLGKDVIDGGGGRDLIIAGTGDDVINSGSGADVIYAGGGDDVVNFSWGVWQVGTKIDGGSGTNTLNIQFNSPDTMKTAYGDSGVRNALNAYTVSPAGKTLSTPAFANVSLAATGFQSAPVLIKVDGTFYNVTDSIGTVDSVVLGTPSTSVVRIDGTPGNDVIVGTSKWSTQLGKDEIYGYAGNDLIIGQSGDDVIYGGGGADVIYGNAGNDTIYFTWSGGNSGILDGGGQSGDVIHILNASAVSITDPTVNTMAMAYLNLLTGPSAGSSAATSAMLEIPSFSNSLGVKLKLKGFGQIAATF